MEREEVRRILKQGEDLFARGDLEQAESSFKAILEAQPDHTEALNNLGVIAFQQDDHKKAYAYLQKAVETDPTYIEAIENLARCAMAMGDFHGTVTLLQKTYETGKVNPGLLNIMEECLVRLGDTSTAIEVLNESLKSDPDQEEATDLLRDIEQNAALSAKKSDRQAADKKLNIGFVSVWFERGQAYVTKMLRDVLSRRHNTFVFARTGLVYGQPKLETSDFWDVPNLKTYHEYQIPPDVIISWIRENNLDTVIFNEEYDWDLVKAAKSTGAKVLTYLDYYKEDWKPVMSLYDKVLCSTLRTFHLVKAHCNAHYMGWAVDTDLFRPLDNGDRKHTFFHNAGWLGINYRKMTPAVILAFDAISRHLPEITLFIHAQTELEKLPSAVQRIIRKNPRVTYHVETVPAPGLYHKGRVLVFPSKLEGLGLPLPEGLACGLPAIVSDAPPMNEFVKDGYNGLLVRVAHRLTRNDNIAFPEELIDINDLALKMAEAARHPQLLEDMALHARLYAETELNLNLLETRMNSLFTGH